MVIMKINLQIMTQECLLTNNTNGTKCLSRIESARIQLKRIMFLLLLD